MNRRGFLRGAIGGLLATNPVAKVLMKLGVPRDMFQPTLISLVRRVYPAMLVSTILGVQPMTGPVGEIFSLRYDPLYIPDDTTGCWGDYII